MPSIDTNVALRWLLDDVPEQTERATALLRSGTRFSIDDATMIEVVYVLEKVLRISRTSVASAVRTLMAEASLAPDRAHWTTTIALYEQHPKLSIADIHLAQRARERNDTLFTFDQKLANQLPTAQLVPD